jgi:acyl carrier protein
METLRKLLTELRPDVDFRSETRLMTDGILESLDLVIIVGEISDAYDVAIEVSNIKPEHFDSAEAMYALIQSKR